MCKAGEEYNAVTKTCSECDFGHFKTNAGNDVSCIKCPQALKTTKTKGSTSADQCTEGEYIYLIDEVISFVW